ncbi:MFS transporter [Ureibacillus sp. Re31]|uniref:MFS transporter n=1 Tax=Ureibacillus galli TaxID=2762222 RepID=A0ABR8XEL6_9BACL|nr:MFS transporter [Ureibacillus galli]MBD8027659.1 MFS transporter [Ureibacillus galli]
MKWRDYPQNVKVRLLTSFFIRALSSAVLPFMALFFAQEMNKLWAGVFLVIAVIVGFLSNLVGGYVSDRFQRKKILIISSAVSASMLLLMTISLLPEQNIITLFAIAFVLFTISSSMEYPTMDALIIDSTTSENRKAIYTADYWLSNLSMAIGTALGGLLYVKHQIELFSILTFVAICITIVYGIWLEDTKRELLEQKHTNLVMDVLHSYKVALQDRPFVKVVVGSMFIIAAELSLNSYIAVRLAESFDSLYIGGFEISGIRMLSILNIENMLLVVLLTFFISRFTDRFSKPKVIVIGLIIYGIGYSVVMSANIWYVLILFAFIATIGELIYSPIFNAEQANMMPADKRGSYAAFAIVGYSGADLISRSSIIVGTFLIPSMMSVYIGIIIMLGIIFIYTGIYRRKTVKVKMNSSF